MKLFNYLHYLHMFRIILPPGFYTNSCRCALGYCATSGFKISLSILSMDKSHANCITVFKNTVIMKHFT